jgi:uncharacterized protein YdhG (YjbR/CyaY superfamily)
MAKTDFRSVDDYIAAQPKNLQKVLRRLRGIIRHPASDTLVAAFKGALTPYRVSKGTLRFALSEPVPEELIARIAKFPGQGGDAQGKGKAGARPDGRTETPGRTESQRPIISAS